VKFISSRLAPLAHWPNIPPEGGSGQFPARRSPFGGEVALVPAEKTIGPPARLSPAGPGPTTAPGASPSKFSVCVPAAAMLGTPNAPTAASKTPMKTRTATLNR
jgi:hypothetical protein